MDNDAQTWLSFFGLREQPFAATADPAYFYATGGHKECLFRLWSNIDGRQGIAVVLGHYGTGKTTLLRKLLTGMRAQAENYNTAVIASPIPSWTSFSLLESIIKQFRLRPAERSFVAYMATLNDYLLANRKRITTLIIDDAQNLNKRGQLELLRLAQNLETAQHKLLNLVCFAQMEWVDILRAAPNFEQRIGMTFTLEPLDVRETRQLIDFRLRRAGLGDRAPVFDEGAIRAIHAYAEGSPRVTVTVCRNALLVAARLKTRRIGQAIILHTLENTTLPDSDKRRRVVSALEPEAIGTPALPMDATGEQATAGRRARPAHSNRANRMLMEAARNARGPDHAGGFGDV